MPTDEISQLIMEKLQNADADTPLKRFLEEILKFERLHWTQANVRYAKDYEDLVNKYAEERER